MREDELGGDGLRHQSGYVFCARRGAMAIINVVERPGGPGGMRTVFWCSLRGRAQWCAEDCGQPTADEGRPPVARAPAEAAAR